MSDSVILCLSWKCPVDTGMVSTKFVSRLFGLFTAQQLVVVQHTCECFIKIAIYSIDGYGFPAVANTYKFLNIDNIFKITLMNLTKTIKIKRTFINI